MATLYAEVWGNRGSGKPVTRTGSQSITGHLRGWDTGIRVRGYKTPAGSQFEVYQTGGSNDPSGSLVGILYEDGTWTPAPLAVKSLKGVA